MMSDPAYSLLIRRARRRSTNSNPGEWVDIGIKGDTINAIAPSLNSSAAVELDAARQFVSPPFVESHIHLDSALTAGEPRWNESGTLFEGIQIW
ncbi:MAG: cytosine deaminase, partial [Cyanobacteriota bacterium]|nr:cytosine deaminase [Cyanobacteriota bacterium]